jgi:hypothetical protein
MDGRSFHRSILDVAEDRRYRGFLCQHPGRIVFLRRTDFFALGQGFTTMAVIAGETRSPLAGMLK